MAIRNHGKGIPSEVIPYIFDRFKKVKSEENNNGTGLGLAIAKQIAERHRIEITVASIQNEGSEFTFQFRF